MALSASAWLATVTKPNPRATGVDIGDDGHLGGVVLGEEAAEEASSMPHERFPTYSLTGPSAGAASASSSAAKAVRWNARVWGTRAEAATRPRRAKRRTAAGHLDARENRHGARRIHRRLGGLAANRRGGGADEGASGREGKAAIFLDIKCQEDASLRTK